MGFIGLNTSENRQQVMAMSELSVEVALLRLLVENFVGAVQEVNAVGKIELGNCKENVLPSIIRIINEGRVPQLVYETPIEQQRLVLMDALSEAQDRNLMREADVISIRTKKRVLDGLVEGEIF